jgi:hypothetical protein
MHESLSNSKTISFIMARPEGMTGEDLVIRWTWSFFHAHSRAKIISSVQAGWVESACRFA